MIDLFRIVEHQASLSSYRATQNEELAVQLELVIELTKPKNPYQDWHPLIATPFRYNPPHPNARFRPQFGKNVFYGSLIDETVFYEHSFHFMKQRMHLSLETDTGVRTLFLTKTNTQEQDLFYIHNEKNLSDLINKTNYSASHQFVQNNPEKNFIIYPSCRDPQQRNNAAILNIEYLEKSPHWENTIKYFYDNIKNQIYWIDKQLNITWKEVN